MERDKMIDKNKPKELKIEEKSKNRRNIGKSESTE